jgi:hypothetical protein
MYNFAHLDGRYLITDCQSDYRLYLLTLNTKVINTRLTLFGVGVSAMYWIVGYHSIVQLSQQETKKYTEYAAYWFPTAVNLSGYRRCTNVDGYSNHVVVVRPSPFLFG